MSKYTEDAKYDNLIRRVNAKSLKPIEFNPEIAKEITELSKDFITVDYKSDKWESLITLAKKEQSDALILALANSKNIPEEYISQLYDMTNYSQATLLLSSDYTPHHIISEILDVMMDEKRLENEGEYYSKRVISAFCSEYSLEYLEDYNYLPFAFLDDKTGATRELEYYLENKNNEFFKKDIPEQFLFNIAQNKKISAHIRDKAFDIAFDPDVTDNLTDHMKKEYYKMCADAIFDITPKTDEEKVMYKKALSNKIWNPKTLPESCQIDFIDRYSKHSNSDPQNILYQIIENTPHKKVVTEAMYKIHTPFLSDSICVNYKRLDNEIMSHLLSFTEPQNLAQVFIKSSQHNHYSDGIILEFSNIKNFYVNLSIIMSQDASASQIDNVINRCVDNTRKRQLEYMRCIRDVCYNFSYRKNGEKILQFVALNLANKDEIPSHLKEVFKEYINENKPERWYAIYNNEYYILENLFKTLRKEFPEFNKLTDVLENKTNEIKKDSALITKYSYIFDIYNKEPSTDVPYSNINMDELCELTKKEQKEFIKDLSTIGNEKIALNIADAIFDKISSYKNRFESHTKMKLIYQLTDLYNESLKVYNKQVDKVINKDLEEKEIEK